MASIVPLIVTVDVSSPATEKDKLPALTAPELWSGVVVASVTGQLGHDSVLLASSCQTELEMKAKNLKPNSNAVKEYKRERIAELSQASYYHTYSK